MKNASLFALSSLVLLHGTVFAADSAFEKPERVILFTSAGGRSALEKTPLSRDAFRTLDPASVEPIGYADVKSDSMSEEAIAYSHPSDRVIEDGLTFSWRDGAFFCLFEEKPVSQFEKFGLSAKSLSDEEKAKLRRISAQAVDYRGALWVYPANAAPDWKDNQPKPLAVLEIVATPAADGRIEIVPAGKSPGDSGFSFVAYVASGKLKFGGVSRVAGKADALRFFADFLSSDPKREFLCLGSVDEGIAHFRERREASGDPEALRNLDERTREESSRRWASLGIDFAKVSAISVKSPSELPKGFRPLPLDGNAGLLEKPGSFNRFAHTTNAVVLHSRTSFRTFDPTDLQPIPYARSMASFPTLRYREMEKGVWFMLRDGALLALFLDHPPVQRDDERLRRTNFAYESALYLYPMDPFLTHGMSSSLSKEAPLAILTIESSSAAPYPFFCAFTPEGHLNFCNCAKPETPKDAARFFFEFLCERPETDVFCLGGEWDNGHISRQRERKFIQIRNKTQKDGREQPSDSEMLEALRPIIEKAKADASALAENYDMVLWHAESAENGSHTEFAESEDEDSPSGRSVMENAMLDSPKPLDANAFDQPVASQEIPSPLEWPRQLRKIALGDRNSFRTFVPSDVGAIDYAKWRNGSDSFPTVDIGELSKGVQFMFRDGALVALFLDHPPERRIGCTNIVYEAALYLYPMDPFLTHGMSPARSKWEPLAVLTIETLEASPHPSFCAFTAEEHLNFGTCVKPESPKDAARFFFEFLCEEPEKDVFCLGKEFDFANKNNGRIRVERERLTLKMLQTAEEENRERPTDEEILEDLRPMIDKAKADASALAETYDMVLWPAENSESDSVVASRAGSAESEGRDGSTNSSNEDGEKD